MNSLRRACAALLFSAFFSLHASAQPIPELAPALSHEKAERELEWTNHTKNTVVLSALSQARPNDECRIDWTRVRPVPAGATAKLPLICQFGTFGSTDGQLRIVRMGLVAFDTKTRTSQTDFVQGRTRVYPKSRYTAEADTCTGRPKKCETEPFRPRLKLCFVDKKDAEETWANVWSVECRGMRTHKLTDSAQIGAELEKIRAQECGIVEEVRVFGHANEKGIQIGSWMGGPRAIDHSLNHGRDRCVMSKDLKIVYKGCNSGHGCLGQLNMYAMAEVLGKEKATVLSPTSYAANSRFTFFKSGSINFKERKLTTVRGGDSIRSEKWEMVGKLSGGGSATLEERCGDLCEETQSQIKEALAYWSARPACEQKIASNQLFHLKMMNAGLAGCESWRSASTASMAAGGGMTQGSIGKLEYVFTNLSIAVSIVEGTDEAKKQARQACESARSIAGQVEKGLPQPMSAPFAPESTPQKSAQTD